MTRLYGIGLTRAEAARHVGSTEQLFGVTLSTRADGPERGVRVLRLRTGGGLEAEIMVDRAMDVAGLAIWGVPIGFHSPAGFRAPWLHEHDAEDGLGWLRSFSGLMNTCGLDHIMGPTEETAEHYHYPYRKTVRHGLHGRVAYLPARLRGYGVDWDGELGVLWAEGEVRQSTMFGENLVLRRRIEAEVGGDSLTVTDRVSSEGFHPTPHAMLYHVNTGWPVLAGTARVVAPIRSTPFTAHDPKATAIGPVEQAPVQSGFVEQVYEHEIATEADGTGFAALVNPAFACPGGSRGIGLLVEWDARAMPAFYQWQNLQEGNYVVGLEPATAHAGSRDDWKRRGELIWLSHGDRRDYRLRLTPLVGEAAILALERRRAAALG